MANNEPPNAGQLPEQAEPRAESGDSLAQGATRADEGGVKASYSHDSSRVPSFSPTLPPHEGYVKPSSYLRRARGYSKPMAIPAAPETAVDKDQRKGLESIRNFLKARTSYDVLPLSFRLIILDTSLHVEKSLNILNQNGIVSAPLWDSKNLTFAGLLTTSDYINVIQYYFQNPSQLSKISTFKLSSLREIEKAIGVTPIETISIHPLRPVYEACARMLETRARRIPLIDIDDDTGQPMVISVITQYRILKFIAVNVSESSLLRKPLKHLNLGTYDNLETATMETPVIEIIHQLVNANISSIPILNSDGVVINVFEAVDVIAVIKGGAYDDLNLTVGEALTKRSEDFPGIYTCSPEDRLDSIFDTLRRSHVHRFAIVDDQKCLKGMLSLSDILEYVIHDGVEEKRH